MERQEKEDRVGPVRLAFTLVELLVVITIIGMLIALLMPAITRAKEEGRRIQCLSNQKNIGMAMLAYAGQHNAFPGWRTNTIVGNPNFVSWQAVLLPNLDRADLWQQVQANVNFKVAVKVFTCPSDPNLDPTNYLGQSAYIANGLILRDSSTGSTAQSPPVLPQTMDYVSTNDGTSTTLMLGENLQSPSTLWDGKPHNWYVDGTGSLVRFTFGYSINKANYAALGTAFAKSYETFSSPYNKQTGFTINQMTANINSGHSGGANVVFCDGRGQFLRDDVGKTLATDPSGKMASPPTVYQVLVTPDGSTLDSAHEPPADENQFVL